MFKIPSYFSKTLKDQLCGSVKYSVVKMGDETNKSKLQSEIKEHEQITK